MGLLFLNALKGLKKKKVHQKMNVADHSVEEQAAFGKHKKHTYE